MKIKAVLFDLDGVLIDSPPIHAWAWAVMFRPFGIELPPERLHREEGRKSEEIAAGIVAEYRLKIPAADLEAMLIRKRQMYREASTRGMRADSRRAIDLLKKSGVKIALVSGSARENVLGILYPEEAALFDAMITAEDYSKAKPNPEPYLTACERLGVEVSESVAVENAPLGVTSAKTAGLFVIAVTTTLPAESLSEAHLILPDLDQLVETLLKHSIF